MECACKLLNWMNKCLNLKISQFKNFSQSVRFIFKHIKRCLNHVFVEFIINDFDFSGCIIIRFQNWGFFAMLWSCNYALDRIFSLNCFRFSFCLSSSIAYNLIYVTIYFPIKGLVVWFQKFIILKSVKWYHFFALNNHHYPSRLSRFYIKLEEAFLLLKYLWVDARIWSILFLVHLHFCFYKALEG